jgi:hypothetical protein
MSRRTVRKAGERDTLIEDDLAEAERQLAAGNRESAERGMDAVEANLRALFTQAGPDTIMRRVGAAYWALGYPAMAGRYWYCLEDGPPEADEARREFERSCANNPFTIQAALPLVVRRYIDQPRMTALNERAHAMHDLIIEVKPSWFARTLPATGCLLVTLAILFTFMTGVTTIAGWWNAK